MKQQEKNSASQFFDSKGLVDLSKVKSFIEQLKESNEQLPEPCNGEETVEISKVETFIGQNSEIKIHPPELSPEIENPHLEMDLMLGVFDMKKEYEHMLKDPFYEESLKAQGVTIVDDSSVLETTYKPALIEQIFK